MIATKINIDSGKIEVDSSLQTVTEPVEAMRSSIKLVFILSFLSLPTSGCQGVINSLPDSKDGGQTSSDANSANTDAASNDGSSQVTDGSSSLPTSPSTVWATAGNAQITVQWTTVAEASSYNIYWNTTGNVTTADSSIPGVTSPYPHTGLVNGTTYYYIVTAVNSYGEGPPSAQASATPQASVPQAPTSLSASAGNGQVTLQWSPSTGASSYNLYWNNTGNVTIYDSKITGVSSPYMHGSLANGTTYFYIVTAQNTGGESAPSNEANATPQAPCSTPITMIANPSELSQGSGWFFVLDFNCTNLEMVLSPIYGSPPNQSSYRSTLATFRGDFDTNPSAPMAIAFNTNFSVINDNPITGIYVYQGAIYELVYTIDCTMSGGCPTLCCLEDTRYSYGLSTSRQVLYVQYDVTYDWNYCSNQGCDPCNGYNWNINGAIKCFEGASNCIVPTDTYYMVTGMDIMTGVPHHNGVPDTWVESLGSRNVMARVPGQNKLIVGLMSSAYRTATNNYLVNHHGASNVVFFDGGGSTKQYISYGGQSRNLDGTRLVPAIVGIRVY